MTTQTTKVAWIGLGAMGSGMALALLDQGFPVKAYDVYPPSLEPIEKAGGTTCGTVAEVIVDADVVCLMVVNSKQVEDVLLGPEGVASQLKDNAVIIVFSTVASSFIQDLARRMDKLGKSLGLVDSPVSGGSTRARQGTLAIMSSGSASAVTRARPVLEALTQKPEGALSIVGDKAGLASDFKMINQVLCAIQICVTGEAMVLGVKMGLNPRLLYNTIRGAAGDSFMFGHRVPWQLRPDGMTHSAMTIIAKDIGIIMDESRRITFPLPMCSTVEQVFTAALGAGLGSINDGQINKLYELLGGGSVAEEGEEAEEIEKARELTIEAGQPPQKVLFVGLGAMGLPMALAVQQAGIAVEGYDTNEVATSGYTQSGGQKVDSLAAGAAGAEVVVLVVNTALQARAVLFEDGETTGIAKRAKLIKALPDGASIILCSTVSPTDALGLETSLAALKRGIHLVDAPCSGGPRRAATGDLSIMASGELVALQKSAPVLQAMSCALGNASNLHYIPGGVGSGSKVKAVNQLLACVHLCAVAEAFNLAAKKGMDLSKVYDVVKGGAAWSYILTDRTPRMLLKRPPVASATTTLVKDLNIVLEEAKRTRTPLWLTATAQQQLTAAVAAGWGAEDDASVGWLWEQYGVSVRS